MSTTEEQPTIATTVAEAVERGVAALDVEPIGENGIAIRLPEGYDVRVFDRRDWLDIGEYVQAQIRLVGVDSLARYCAEHQDESSRCYVRDVYGRGVEVLQKDTDFAKVVIDDNPAGNVVGRCAHVAVLVLRPTAAARRWGAALAAGPLAQRQFLSLVEDGIGEIGSPDGAELRELISNLYSTSTASVSEIVSTGGQGRIVLDEQVTLRTGKSAEVEFPERMTLVLQPFAGLPDTVQFDVKISPRVGQGKVTFELSAPSLDDVLAKALGDIAGEISERTGMNPHWTP